MTLDWTVAKKCIGRYVITNAIQIEQLQNKWAISIKEQLFALDRTTVDCPRDVSNTLRSDYGQWYCKVCDSEVLVYCRIGLESYLQTYGTTWQIFRCNISEWDAM